MTDWRKDMELRILELVRAADALRTLAAGDEQAACNSVSVTHYAQKALRDDYYGLLAEFRAKGIEPGGAFGSNLPDRPVG